MKKIIVAISVIAIGLSGLSGCANMTERDRGTADHTSRSGVLDQLPQ